MKIGDRHPVSGRHEGWVSCGLLLLMLIAYNANGREIGSYDTRPTELAARELVLRGTLALNHVVGATPAYADRWGILLARDGRYRSVYSPLPAIEAAMLTWPFWKLGLIDINAPLAPRVMAVATASLLVGLAVVLSYRCARLWIGRGRAVVLSVGLGLGTGLWSSASQTLWQTETALFGLACALWGFSHEPRSGRRWTLLVGLGLSLALLARPQLGPAIVVLIAGTYWRWGFKHAAIVCLIVSTALVPWMAFNWRWFGHPIGALPLLEGVNASLHMTGRTFGWNPEGWAGLLISPNRGILVFSPVVLVALAGIVPGVRRGAREPFLWCAVAIGAQYALYASYSVWWGGHTYGPRYMVDVLPLAVPLAALTLEPVRLHRGLIVAGASALVWSMIVAGTGAFFYPNDAWNTDPDDVDRNHARLWSVADNQILRCWHAGPSPQNFDLFSRAAVRQVE